MIPCPSCARFIRTDADGCPFCRVVLNEPSTMPMVAGVILGLTMAACGGQGNDDGASGSTSFGEMEVSAYGGPTVDSMDSVGQTDDSPPDEEDSSDGADDTTTTGNESSSGDGSGSESGTGSGSESGSESGSTGPLGTGSTTA